MNRHLLAAASLLAVAAPALGQSAPIGASDAEIATILDQGQQHSQVMLTAEYMDDVIGARMTNSPGMRKAEGWTQAKFTEWGLKNVHKEAFDFGRGWWIERSSVRMITPRPVQLTAIPVAWTPGTNGALTAPIIVAPMSKEADFARFRGQLSGKIVLVSMPGTGDEPSEPAFHRFTDAEIGKLDIYQPPHYDPAAPSGFVRYVDFTAKLDAFLKAEGAVAIATSAGRDGKLVSGEGYHFQVGATPTLPVVQIAAEDYRRLARLAKIGPAPTLEIDSRVHFEDGDRNAYNIIAEIPGSDPQAGYVMAGAHLDSWAAGDGAADNGAGSAMIMEAARILAATGVRPKRTIRFALWAGEEQGLLGSFAYVEGHLAHRGGLSDPRTTGIARYVGYGDLWPVTPRPGYRDLAAYFNIDNGSGKLRGLYAENNVAAATTLRGWLAPFASMGAGAVVVQKTEGTDHELMAGIGLPAFQFIQDPLDYETRVHHSSIDTFDHLKADDMRQGSTVLAALLLDAADAKEALPRAPLPTRPVPSDPFSYERHDD